MVRKRKRDIEIVQYKPSSDAERKIWEDVGRTKNYYRGLDMNRPPEFDEEMCNGR